MIRHQLELEKNDYVIPRLGCVQPVEKLLNWIWLDMSRTNTLAMPGVLVHYMEGHATGLY